MKVLLLGDCIANGQNVLLSQVTHIDNYQAEGIEHVMLSKLKQQICDWSNKENFAEAKAYLKQEEKNHSWPCYLPNCTNLSVTSETFQGMHKKLREYISTNEKPDLVLLTDFSHNHRCVVVKCNNVQYVVKRDVQLIDKEQSTWPEHVYKIFKDKCNMQEKKGKKFLYRKNYKSFLQLTKLLEYNKIDYKMLIFRHENKDIYDDYLYCNHFLDLYKLPGDKEDCTAKLNAQKEIGQFVLKYIENKK